MKIAFFELEKWEEEYIKDNLEGHKLFFFNRPLNVRSVNKIKDIDIIACFIYSELNEEVLRDLPKLKFIAAMSTGFDHINIAYCKKIGIKISNVPSYGGNTVAEHTFGLILHLSKKLNDSIYRTKRNDFSLNGLMGFDLKGKTIGVIGVGNIGRHVVKIAKGFEMNVIAHSLYPDNKLSKELGFKWTSFDELLRKSDIITFHVPLNDSTRHMISMNSIKKIKKGAYLINTARGEIVDTKALLYGLNHDILAGAGLDVLEGEIDIKDEKALLKNTNKKIWENFLQNHLLLKEKNVIVTPHSAFYTREALQRILDITIENIKTFSKGKTMNRVVYNERTKS